MKLDYFFRPRSVAIIGASRSPRKIGHQILANLITGGYQGKIYPVNPAARNILNHQVYSSINIIKDRVDLAVLALPAALVLPELENCGRQGVKNVIVIAAGFGELSAAGKKAELEMKAIAKKYQLNILGPNCLGLISSQSKLNASFAGYRGFNDITRRHNIALVSQSGAIASSILDFADSNHIGLSHFVSLGNKADLDEADIFAYLITDRQTEMVAVYLEQIKDGSRFLKQLSRLAKVKPVVVLKAGQTLAGQEAAKSHTGSLVGSYSATKTAVASTGAIMVDDLSSLFDLLIMATRWRKINNHNLSIVSNAGGPLVLSADLALTHGLALPVLSASVVKKLGLKMPPLVQRRNPLDILGDADAERYHLSLEVILADANCRNLLVILTPQTITEVKASAEAIVAVARKYKDKMISAVFIGGQEVAAGIKLLRQNFIPVFAYPESAIAALAKMSAYYHNLSRARFCQIAPIKKLDSPDQLLDFLESLNLLKRYNLPIATTRRMPNKIDKLSYPLAAKIVGPNLIHKSEYRAVFPKVESAKELKRLSKNPLLKQSDNYLVIQERIEGGVEMILGFKRDTVFGPIMMLGYGGVYTEVFQDTVLSLADLDLARATELISRLKVYPLLSGVRTGRKLALRELAKALVNLTKLAQKHPEIKELDINPLFVSENKVKVADVRIII